MSLVLTARGDETVLAIDVATPLMSPLRRIVAAQLPGVELAEATDPDHEGERHVRYLRVTPDVRMLQTAEAFEDRLQRTTSDPISGLLAEVKPRGDGLHPSIRFRLRNATTTQRRRAQRVAATTAVIEPSWPRLGSLYAVRANGTPWERLTVWPLRFMGSGEVPSDTLTKLDKHLCHVVIELVVVASSRDRAIAQKRLDSMAAAFAPFTAPGTVRTWPLRWRCVTSE